MKPTGDPTVQVVRVLLLNAQIQKILRNNLEIESLYEKHPTILTNFKNKISNSGI